VAAQWKVAVDRPLALARRIAEDKIADELARCIIASVPRPSWPGPKSVDACSPQDFSLLAKHLPDRPLLHYIFGFFWRHHADCPSAKAMAQYSNILLSEGQNAHGWCLLEGWLPFGRRLEPTVTTVSSILVPKIDAQALERLKGRMTFNPNASESGIYFPPALLATRSSCPLILSGLFVPAPQQSDIMFGHSTSAAKKSLILESCLKQWSWSEARLRKNTFHLVLRKSGLAFHSVTLKNILLLRADCSTPQPLTS
jgi:hypothetical protein